MIHLDRIVALAGLFGTTSIFIVATARVYLRRLELQHSRAPELVPALEQRLERIEQAVDAIAVEMERVSEGQRFTTRLLAERAAPAVRSVGGPPRVDTPH